MDGQRHRQIIGLAICAVGIGVATLVPRGDSPTPPPALRGTAAAADTGPGTASGGSLEATVAWPLGAAERSDICVVVFDGDGRVADELVGSLEPIAGLPVAGRLTAEGLVDGRYTIYVHPCATHAKDSRVQVEPQYLCGVEDAKAACWVEVAGGARVDVGTIALRRSGLETWQAS
ncbi:hypothetical protein [Nocardioides bizhenqiangii]|uniref:Serine/threonine protein kinase n=1 Tax=Nocardioides bizhenqiangii TaxID=3095076 RepID=A0ABZ0ZQJ9_9ACTN|nr:MULTISPECIES: hypothetical protein [unclassified Nocardioides]MDZ5621265.1 hypothetical protein [Nocardioides sp. HM23]WQQ25892.1 hypothetical protein SHK19_18235 [Nocardioides sp. HM61]